jgi:hypothetical protein
MSGEEIVSKLKTRRRCSGSVGSFFLVSAEADLLLDYIVALELAAGKSAEDKNGDTTKRAASQ